MGVLFIIIIGLFCFVSAIVMPWANHSRLRALRQEIKQLQATIGDLTKTLEKEGVVVTDIAKPEQPADTAQAQTEPMPETVGKWKAEKKSDHKPEESESEENKTSEPKPNKVKTTTSFEQEFGARLPVWVGGIALALAGFFLVKYSIDNNLLSPTVRVILGALFGVTLLYAADWARRKSNFANGIRIAQSLSGAGIAILYASIFAATSLYQLLPNLLGFLGMAFITATAVVLSLRHGPPIALLGLVGGLLTPALIKSEDPSAALLFIYLYLVFGGLMLVIKRQNWWTLSSPS